MLRSLDGADRVSAVSASALPPPASCSWAELERHGPMTMRYAELQVTTNYSFLRGGSHPGELVYQAAGLGHYAIGIADRNSLAGVVRAYSAIKEYYEEEEIPRERRIKLLAG